MDYANTYNGTFMSHSDGIKSLQRGIIKFGDALAAVAYAHGIEYAALVKAFPEIKQNERWENSNVPGQDYTVEDQLQFIRDNKTRTPLRILEIGAGRGEVIHFCRALGLDVVAIEPGADAVSVIENTQKHLFGDTPLPPYVLHNDSIHNLDIDYSEFDTILMVESIEHILAEHFDPQWERIASDFAGYFIVVNWKAYHPIAVGQFAGPHIHCRLVNDALYDSYAAIGQTLVRDRSHLCIQL